MKKKILVIDDDLDLGFLLASLMKSEGFAARSVTEPLKGLALIKDEEFDLVLCDFRLPGMDGTEMLKRISVMRPGLPVIIVTGYSDVRTAVQSMQLGAVDYVNKPIIPDEIVERVKSALENAAVGGQPAPGLVQEEKSEESPKKRKKKGDVDEQTIYSGNSSSFQQVLNYVELVGPTNMSVIIEGETGSGKELVAKMLHRSSDRASKPYYAVDCGAIPEHLAASELFGHLKGSFTGALKDREGYFLSADGGTLFLDEIGNLSYEIQVQLLRVLQEGMVRRVGETDVREVDVRVVVATNESLLDMVSAGKFREDLYHRLNEFKIRVPALRNRGDDLVGFAHFFLLKANEELNKEVEGFSEAALTILKGYHWPGNLRELGNVVKRATLLCTGNTIGEAELPNEIRFVAPQKEAKAKKAAPASGKDLKNISHEAELEAIMSALRQCNYNRSMTAKKLGIDRKTLYNKMRSFGIT